MNALHTFLPASFTDALGTTILHSLWQGALIGLALLIAITFIPRNKPGIRYAAGVLAIIAMVILPVFTFFQTWTPETASPATATFAQVTSATPTVLTASSTIEAGTWLEQVSEFVNTNRVYLVMAWMAGMIFFFFRLAGGLILAQRLRNRGTTPAPDEWVMRLERLNLRMRVGQPVTLLESVRVHTPTVIGWLKPVILLPVGMIGGFTADQLEMILAHELAHIRRHDYLLNLLLSAAEVLLFYHPAMWLASRFVRQERENCCDAVALSYMPDKQQYARTLLRLEDWRSSGVAMTASGGSLTGRISRILNLGGQRKPVHLAIAITLALALWVSVSAYGKFSQPNDADDAAGWVTLDDVVITPDGDSDLIADYTYIEGDTDEVTITMIRNGEKTEIHMVAGRIADVKVNGVPVPAEEYPRYQEMAFATLDGNRRATSSAVSPIPPPPPAPPAPEHKAGESEEDYEKRLEAWENEMEIWEENIGSWEEEVARWESENHTSLPPSGDENAWGDFEREMERLRAGLGAQLGDEKRWEDFGRRMEDMAKQLAEKMEQRGQLEAEMDGEHWEEFGKEMEKWGEQFGKEMEAWGEEMARSMEGVDGEWMESLHRSLEKLGEIDIPDMPEIPSIPHVHRDHASGDMTARIGSILEDQDIITDEDEYRLTISADALTVNGNKMPADLHRQILEIVEDQIDDSLDGKREVKITKKRNSTNVQVD